MAEPDFEQIARGIVERVESHIGDGVNPFSASDQVRDTTIRHVADRLRQVWNARGSADIEAVQYEADAYIVAPSGVDVTDLQTHQTPVAAIKALDV